MLNKRLTVIVCTYNHKKYIARCLDSIMSQKTNFDFIVKVVDDCSTDGTSSIIIEYEKKYPKIIGIIREKNLGAENSMYPIFCNIDTEYFCAIDGDDYLIDNNKFQLQVDALDVHKDCTICAHKTKVIESKTNKEFFIGLKENNKNSFFNIYNCPYLHYSSRMYRNIIDFSREDKKIIWDIFIYYKFLSKGKLCYIDKAMSVYNRSGFGLDSKMSEEEAYISGMKSYYELDLFFNFKYTKIFRKLYLPELAKKRYLDRFNWKIPRWYRIIYKIMYNIL